MEKIYQNLAILGEALAVATMMGCKLNGTVYQHLNKVIHTIEQDLKDFEVVKDNDCEKKLVSFTKREEFVNNHLNLADTQNLFQELVRRGFRVVDDEDEQQQNS